MNLKKIIKTILKTVFSIVVIILSIYLFQHFYRSNPRNVVIYETTNEHIFSDAKLSAHRSGAGIYPEESMLAFKSCVKNLCVDYYEFDLHITKDNQLILLHDSTLDRTTDSAEVFGEKGVRPENKTLAELKKLNIGAKFVDKDGKMPYADVKDPSVLEDLRITSLNEVLDFLMASGDFRYIIEIKNSGELGKKSLDILYNNLKERGILDKVVFGCFHQEVSDYLDEKYNDFKRGAYGKEVCGFTFAALFNKKNLKHEYEVLQVPCRGFNSAGGLNFGFVRFINYAHKNNIAVQYWTVNDKKEMDYLASINADLIMSDYPDLYY